MQNSALSCSAALRCPPPPCGGGRSASRRPYVAFNRLWARLAVNSHTRCYYIRYSRSTLYYAILYDASIPFHHTRRTHYIQPILLAATFLPTTLQVTHSAKDPYVATASHHLSNGVIAIATIKPTTEPPYVYTRITTRRHSIKKLKGELNYPIYAIGVQALLVKDSTKSAIVGEYTIPNIDYKALATI
jgi:hypothetical protein